MDFTSIAHLWIAFSLASAFFHASRLAVTKQLTLTFSPRALTIHVNLACLVVTLPLVFWYHNFPFHDPVWLLALLCGGLLSGLGGWALNAALARTDMSIVGPLMTLSPGFAILIEWLLTGTLPGPLGVAGIALLIGGSWLLGRGEKDLEHAPIRGKAGYSGYFLALVAAFCFAAASVFGRIAIHKSDPLSFAVTVAIVNPLVLFLVFTLHDRHFYRELIDRNLPRQLPSLALLGVLFALMRIADQIALSLTLASYAMAVKRTTGIFSILLGHWLFAEQRLQRKLGGALAMLSGLLVLLLG